MRSTRLLRLTFTTLCVAAPAAAFAEDLRVPQQYRTIDAAVAVAEPGDRILVRGGRYEGLAIAKDDVTIVARGSTLTGVTLIAGSHVRLEGFRVAGNGAIVVTGDDVTIAKNRLQRAQLSVQGGERATVEKNIASRSPLTVIVGKGAVVRSNRFDAASEMKLRDGRSLVEDNVAGAGIDVWGEDHLVRSNRARAIFANVSDRAVIERNVTPFGIHVTGNGATVTSNTVPSSVRNREGIEVIGDGAIVTSNSVTNAMYGVAVTGNGSTISGNDLAVGSIWFARDGGTQYSGCPGIVVSATAPGATVENNVIVHTSGTGIVMTVDGASVRDNVVHGISSATSIAVNGSDNRLTGNEISQSGSDQGAGSGIAVNGDENAVEDNVIQHTFVDGILVVAGSGNTLAGNDLTRNAGCGIMVSASADGTVVSDCSVSACGLGLVNDGTGTSVSGSTISTSRFADVLDMKGFQLFEGNTFKSLSHDEWLLPQH